MTRKTHAENLDICGCCGTQLQGPGRQNSPGQSTIRYRLGTHARFLERMLARLSRQKTPDGDKEGQRPLTRLTTRASNDAAIALLDAWAVIADVLTFYQERIANEGFLLTALERRSILELARAIGYELNPGVAASTYLAFRLDDSAGAPGETTIPAGTQVQSIPAEHGKLPQTFETSTEFTAKANWNNLRPRLRAPQNVTTAASQLYLEGIGLNLEPSDLLLLVARDEHGQITGAVPRRIQEVKEDLQQGWTLARLETNGNPAVFQPGRVERATALAPAAEGKAASATGASGIGSAKFNTGSVGDLILRQTLTEAELQATLKMNRWRADDLLDHIPRLPMRVEGVSEVYVLRERVGIFGNNAPNYESLPDKISSPYSNWDDDWEVWKDSTKDSIDFDYYTDADIYLERVVPGVVADGWAVLERPRSQYAVYRISAVAEGSLAGFAISGKATGLELSDLAGNSLNNNTTDKPQAFELRKTTVHLKSAPMALAELTLTDELQAGDRELVLDSMVLALKEGSPVAPTGEQADAEGVQRSEILILEQITHRGGHTTLHFEQGLQYSYVRDTASINANVVPATHGETVEEVLASGDASQTNQRFKLRKPPLTFISSPISSGSESTLSVRVNDVLWEEKPSFYRLDENSQNYILRIDNASQASVIFGDGKHGARLPTGRENVVARYRSGIGSSGEVGANSLTLLKTRPLGIREVTNPVPASGAGDPETLDSARENAPQTVLTLDRIVSLKDFEDFARAFAGIGKAQAVSLWNAQTQLVHITIADTNGDEVDPASQLFINLRDAINANRDPLQEVRLGSYQPLFFVLNAKVLIDPAYQWEILDEAINAALRGAFSFQQRAFAQPVTAAEVVNVIHQVEWVTAVDLDEFHLVTESGEPEGTTLASVIPARTARFDPITQTILPAELLLINEFGISLTEMTS